LSVERCNQRLSLRGGKERSTFKVQGSTKNGVIASVRHPVRRSLKGEDGSSKSEGKRPAAAIQEAIQNLKGNRKIIAFPIPSIPFIPVREKEHGLKFEVATNDCHCEGRKNVQRLTFKVQRKTVSLREAASQARATWQPQAKLWGRCSSPWSLMRSLPSSPVAST